jgi:hypothetical protein
VRRVIPPQLKLAILSRGRLALRASKADWFLEVARSSGQTWPDRLRSDLDEIAPQFPVTFELFLRQRSGMTPADINESIAAYLALRRRQDLLPSCFILIYAWVPAASRLTIEKALDVDISRLFRRPGVRLREGEDPHKYVLLAYLCLPPQIADYIDPEPSSPPPLSSPMPPLEGRTKTSAQVHLRSGPGTQNASLGVEAGVAALVEVLEKQQNEDHVWYKLRLREPLRVIPSVGASLSRATFLPAGTEGWMVEDGIEILVAPWALFRNDLGALERALSRWSLDDRITILRQRMHSKELPFDAVIGAARGTEYLEDIRFDPAKWQLGKDYQAVLAPDGRWLDLQHLFVGLDVLHRPERQAEMFGISIGKNYGASTWAGDVGAGATDAMLHYDARWEGWNPGTREADRLEYYFSSRAPDHDLLGDVDAWGIQALRARRRDVKTLDGFIALYYENTSPGGVRSLTAQRRGALEIFLNHYGFTYDYQTDFANYPALPQQRNPARRMLREIHAFARIWLFRREPMRLISRDESKKEPKHTGEMTELFLFWLENAVIENGATVGP